MKVLLIDNYDSFTFNLVHYIEGLDATVDVFRNDEIPFDKINEYDRIVLSPGPGLPSESGQLMSLIDQFVSKIPVLGVCLGFQAIAEHFGATLINQMEVKHGVSIKCNFDNTSKLFSGLPNKFDVGLYHSWAVSDKGFPDILKKIATSDESVLMAFEHHDLPICGVQFHPESILTQHGHKIVENFLCNFD